MSVAARTMGPAATFGSMRNFRMSVGTITPRRQAVMTANQMLSPMARPCQTTPLQR